MRCELCGARIEYRDLGKVLAHEGPLPLRSELPHTARFNLLREKADLE